MRRSSRPRRPARLESQQRENGQSLVNRTGFILAVSRLKLARGMDESPRWRLQKQNVRHRITGEVFPEFILEAVVKQNAALDQRITVGNRLAVILPP